MVVPHLPPGLLTFLQHNQLFVGGAGLGVVGGAVAYLRNIPNQIGAWIKRQFVVTVVVQSTSSSYNWLIRWLDEHPYSKKARDVSASVVWRPSVVGEDEIDSVAFTPAPGAPHVFFHQGRLL